MTEQHFRPRNWDKFQGYQKRGPKWIKSYTALLMDVEFRSLTEMQQCHLMKLWLLYATSAGSLPLVCGKLAHLIGAKPNALAGSLDVLISLNWLEVCPKSVANIATVPDAKCRLVEREREEEREREKESTKESLPSRFEEWWLAYPRKAGKGHARKAYAAALKKTSEETLLAKGLDVAAQYAGTEAKFIPHAATWLSGERWTDEAAAVAEAEDPAWAGVL